MQAGTPAETGVFRAPQTSSPETLHLPCGLLVISRQKKQHRGRHAALVTGSHPTNAKGLTEFPVPPRQICVENQSQKWPEDTTGRGGPEARGPFGLRNAPLRLLSRLLMPSEPRALTSLGRRVPPPDSRPSSLHSASRGTKFPPWPGPRDCLSVSARPRAASRAADGACDCPGPRVGPPRAPPSKGPRPVHAQELPDGRPSLQALLGDASIPTRAQETHFSDPESTGSSPPSGTHLSAPAS